MREVKFRAWHYEAKEILVESYPGNAFQWLREKQPVIIEQWTGLKDKNGRDVYEGDILLTDTSWHVIVRWIDESSKDMGNPRCGWNIHRGSWLDKCEVIGNIHENPELLEVVK